MSGVATGDRISDEHHLDNRSVITTPEGVEVPLVHAGMGSRWIARTLDSVIKWVAITIVSLILGSSDISLDGWSAAFFFIVVFGVFFFYDVVFEVLNRGRTPGKAAAGLRVVRGGGQPVTFWPSVTRNIIGFFETTLLLPAMISMLVTRREQRLGDLAANTVVVRERLVMPSAQADLPAWANDPAAPFLSWDTSAVTAQDAALLRRFLERRNALMPGARTVLARQLAERIRPKVPSVPAWNDEQFLVSVLAARSRRLGDRV